MRQIKSASIVLVISSSLLLGACSTVKDFGLSLGAAKPGFSRSGSGIVGAKTYSKHELAGLLVNDAGVEKTRDDIRFAARSIRLQDEASYVITDVVQYLSKHKNKTATIAGHTDETGSEKDNLDLSVQRAFAVRNALIAAGIAAHRLEPVGFGEMRPVQSNETVEGRRANRRVSISFPNH